MRGRLYDSLQFNPIQDIGGTIMLIDGSGPFGGGVVGPFHEVQFLESFKTPQPHAVLVLWTQGTVAAGYSLPAGAPTGTINSLAQSNPNPFAPPQLQAGKYELLQVRWALRPLALTGPVLHDIDVQVFQPTGAAKGALLGGQSRFNMAEQFPDPADTQVAPAQGANEAAPSAFPFTDNYRILHQSELFIYEQTFTPGFTIINNGSAALSAGTIGIRVSGYRFGLRPLAATSEWPKAKIFGQTFSVPPEWFSGQIPVVPIAGRQQSAGSLEVS